MKALLPKYGRIYNYLLGGYTDMVVVVLISIAYEQTILVSEYHSYFSAAINKTLWPRQLIKENI